MFDRSERDNFRGTDRGEGHISLGSSSGNNGTIGKEGDLACSKGTRSNLAIFETGRR